MKFPLIFFLVLSIVILVKIDLYDTPDDLVSSQKSKEKSAKNKTENGPLKDIKQLETLNAISQSNIKTKNIPDSSNLKEIEQLEIYNNKNKSPVIIRQYKLMWFLNPKVASTSTLCLLAKMSNIIDPVGKVNNLGRLENFTQLHDYTSLEAYNILNSPEWKRVISLRDPKERMLSAYIGKEEKFHSERWKISKFKRKCLNENCSNTDIEDCMHHKYTFSQFLDITKTCNNAHWDPQYKRVDDWKYINYVINFNSLATDTEILLRKLGNGAWNKFGKTGWGVNGTSAVFVENTLFHSDAKLRYNEFYTPELEKVVEERYARDYAILRKYFPEEYDN